MTAMTGTRRPAHGRALAALAAVAAAVSSFFWLRAAITPAEPAAGSGFFPLHAWHADAAQWDDGGRAVLWQTNLRFAYGPLTLRDLERRRADDGQDEFARMGPAPSVSMPVRSVAAVAAAAVKRVKLVAFFPAVQPRPPRARAIVQGDGPADLAVGEAAATPRGAQWHFEIDMAQAAETAPPGGPSAPARALRVELIAFDGDRVVLEHLEMLGDPDRAAGRFLIWTSGGVTRTVWSAPPGESLTLRARRRGARLQGEVFRAGTGDWKGAVSIRDACGSEQARALSLAGDTGVTAYDLPLPGGCDGEVAVTLVSDAGSEARALWTEPSQSGGTAPPRGVILISVDTLRADALLPPGGASSLPRLLARARRAGQVATRHYSASTYTLPSHVSLLSGAYPTAHGANDVQSPAPLDDRSYLPAILARRGFRTAAIVDGLMVSAAYGFNLGFHEYAESPRAADLDWTAATLASMAPRLRDRDFFLFVHTYFVHDYGLQPADAVDLPPDLRAYHRRFGADLHRMGQERSRAPGGEHALLARTLRALYDDRGRRFDAWLETFLDRVEREFAPDPPLVILTSDHGESFGEGPGRRAWHHSGWPDESMIRVPLVILHPDRRPRPDLAGLTSAVDVAPAVLDALDLRSDAEAFGGDGRTLSAEGGREVYNENYSYGYNCWASIGPRLKAVENVSSAGRAAPEPAVLLLGSEPTSDPAAVAEYAAARARRLDYLRRRVDGLFVQATNHGPRARTLTLRMVAGDAAARPDRPLAAQLHLLEDGDRVDAPPSGASLDLRLELPPGDVDLVVVKEDTEIDLTPDAPDTLFVGGQQRTATRVLRAGRLRTGSLRQAPAVAGSGITLEVWENAPRPRPPTARPVRSIPIPTERLRALGYLE